MSLTRASTSAVSGGAQHVTGPLAGTQGAPVVPQGTLQQPTQQAQPLPSMGIPLSQAGTLFSNLLNTHARARVDMLLFIFYLFKDLEKINKEYKVVLLHF